MSLWVARAAERQPGPRPPVRESGPPGPSRPSSGTSVSLSCCVWGPVLSVPPTAPVRLTPARASGPGTRPQHSAPAPSPCSWHLVSVTSTSCSDLPGLPVSQPAPWGAVPGVLPFPALPSLEPSLGRPQPAVSASLRGSHFRDSLCLHAVCLRVRGGAGGGCGAGWGSADAEGTPRWWPREEPRPRIPPHSVPAPPRRVLHPCGPSPFRRRDPLPFQVLRDTALRPPLSAVALSSLPGDVHVCVARPSRRWVPTEAPALPPGQRNSEPRPSASPLPGLCAGPRLQACPPASAPGAVPVPVCCPAACTWRRGHCSLKRPGATPSGWSSTLCPLVPCAAAPRPSASSAH